MRELIAHLLAYTAAFPTEVQRGAVVALIIGLGALAVGVFGIRWSRRTLR